LRRQLSPFADVAWGNGVFVACANPTRLSSDGETWEVGGPLTFEFNYRASSKQLLESGTDFVGSHPINFLQFGSVAP
jgi:hypothetical protein